MTIKELIQQLSKYPEDYQVFIRDSEYDSVPITELTEHHIYKIHDPSYDSDFISDEGNNSDRAGENLRQLKLLYPNATMELIPSVTLEQWSSKMREGIASQTEKLVRPVGSMGPDYSLDKQKE